jgi:alpha-D-xyloside xylohydrolase
MLGPALLVAPVFTETGEVDYYLPAGTWHHLLTGELATGPGWRREKYDYFNLPLWVNVDHGSKWECLSLITSR